MRCLVLVRFKSGGSLPPNEFFASINAQWHWVETNTALVSGDVKISRLLPSRTAMCVSECESIKELTSEIAAMPGAGFINVEVIPINSNVTFDARRERKTATGIY